MRWGKPVSQVQAKIRHKRKCSAVNIVAEGSTTADGGDVRGSDKESTSSDKIIKDTWQLTASVLIRVHNTPRTKLFTPQSDPSDPCPIPIEYLDIMRRTDTSAPTKAESNLEDYWVDRQMQHRELSEEWVGRTQFSLFRTVPPAGQYSSGGRMM